MLSRDKNKFRKALHELLISSFRYKNRKHLFDFPANNISDITYPIPVISSKTTSEFQITSLTIDEILVWIE